MSEQDFNTAVTIGICAVIALCALVMFAQRKSKTRPNRRVGLPEPSRDARRYMTPGSL